MSTCRACFDIDRTVTAIADEDDDPPLCESHRSRYRIHGLLAGHVVKLTVISAKGDGEEQCRCAHVYAPGSPQVLVPSEAMGRPGLEPGHFGRIMCVVCAFRQLGYEVSDERGTGAALTYIGMRLDRIEKFMHEMTPPIQSLTFRSE